MSIPSIITILPRSVALDDSDCHVGTVLVFMPFPMPVTIRPTIKCGSSNAVACNKAPVAMVTQPQKIVFRRPRGLPMKIVKIEPKKQPRLYEATAMPWFVLREALTASEMCSSTVLISGKYLIKDGRSRRPPVTPWSYPNSLVVLYQLVIHAWSYKQQVNRQHHTRSQDCPGN